MIKDKPWLQTDHTKIWKVELPPEQALRKPSCLSCWLVYAPWVHPLWNYHFVCLIHLRPGDNLPEPIYHFDGATHELLVLALDPRKEPDKIDVDTFEPLHPPSIAQQFVAENDASALCIIESHLSLVACKGLSLDSDFRSQWKSLLPTISVPINDG